MLLMYQPLYADTAMSALCTCQNKYRLYYVNYRYWSIGTFESSRYFHMVVITALEINTGSDNDLLSTEHCLNFRRS